MLRNKFIKKYIKDKSVLDLGFLGEKTNMDFSYLHSFILKHARKTTGVDIHEKRVKALEKKGYNVICDNVIELKKVKKINKKYEVVVAGELIEHLENPGLFIENIKPLLKKEGIVIFTTPNMFSLRYIVRHILFGEEAPLKINKENVLYGHVGGYTKSLLKILLLREGFKIVDFSYVVKDEYRGFKGNLEKFICKLIPKFSVSIAYVVKVK